jgi:hypothetical protein
MKVKVSEATGPVLDWLVAKAEGALAPVGNLYLMGRQLFIGVGGDLGEPGQWVVFAPSTDWAQGGPLIANNIFRLEDYGDAWEAEGANGIRCRGETELIAVCRCVVASRLGDEVDVPEELCKTP